MLPPIVLDVNGLYPSLSDKYMYDMLGFIDVIGLCQTTLSPKLVETAGIEPASGSTPFSALHVYPIHFISSFNHPDGRGD